MEKRAALCWDGSFLVLPLLPIEIKNLKQMFCHIRKIVYFCVAN